LSHSQPAPVEPRPEPPPLYRWMVLVFIALAMFGNYYVFDAMAPVFDLLKDQLGYTDQQLGLLYTIYSIGAILALLFAGYIIDRWGTKKSLTLFAGICVVAAFITAFSGDLATMLTGRFLLGFGSEPLIVAVTTALAKWFKGKELSLAFGLNLMIARLGSVSADTSPAWARPLYANWQDPLWLATAIAGISVATALLYWLAERRAESTYRLGEAEETEKVIDLEGLFPATGSTAFKLRSAAATFGSRVKALYTFSASYWYVVALCVVFYSVIFPFRAFAIKYFQEAHGTSREVAGLLNSLLPWAAIIATPIFGYMVDRVGKRALFMALGSLLLLPLFLMVTYLPPGVDVPLRLPFYGDFTIPILLLVTMVLLGLAFSLIPAVMWPSVAYIVEGKRLGTAYALMTLCQQLGMAAVPWMVGVLNDRFRAGPEHPAGYSPGMWLFTALASLGLFFSYQLWRTEKGPGAHGLETITIKQG
jgi:MFS family permease